MVRKNSEPGPPKLTIYDLLIKMYKGSAYYILPRNAARYSLADHTVFRVAKNSHASSLFLPAFRSRTGGKYQFISERKNSKRSPVRDGKGCSFYGQSIVNQVNGELMEVEVSIATRGRVGRRWQNTLVLYYRTRPAESIF